MHSRPKIVPALLAASCAMAGALAGCESPPDENAEAVAALGATSVIELSGVRFQIPATWAIEDVTTETRVASVLIPGGPDQQDATMVVYYFGVDGAGNVASNIARWCNQIEVPDATLTDGRPIVARRSVNDITLHTVDASGTYVAETFPGSGEFTNEPDQRLLAAIIETDAGPYYVKALGPRNTMRRWDEDWNGVLSSVEAAPVVELEVRAHP